MESVKAKLVPMILCLKVEIYKSAISLVCFVARYPRNMSWIHCPICPFNHAFYCYNQWLLIWVRRSFGESTKAMLDLGLLRVSGHEVINSKPWRVRNEVDVPEVSKM